MPSRHARAVRRGRLVLGREQAVESAVVALSRLIVAQEGQRNDSAQAFVRDLLTPYLLLRSIRTRAHFIHVKSHRGGHVELSNAADSNALELAPGTHAVLEYYEDLYDAHEHPPTLRSLEQVVDGIGLTVRRLPYKVELHRALRTRSLLDSSPHPPATLRGRQANEDAVW